MSEGGLMEVFPVLTFYRQLLGQSETSGIFPATQANHCKTNDITRYRCPRWHHLLQEELWWQNLKPDVCFSGGTSCMISMNLKVNCGQYGYEVCVCMCVWCACVCVTWAIYWLNFPLCQRDGMVLRGIGGNKTMDLSCCFTQRALGFRH